MSGLVLPANPSVIVPGVQIAEWRPFCTVKAATGILGQSATSGVLGGIAEDYCMQMTTAAAQYSLVY